MERNFKIEIKEVFGTCDSDIFQKMVEKGDVTSDKITSFIGENVVIDGYAVCHIETDKKSFDMGYYATDKGIISTGSGVFLESVKDYIEDVNKFKIVEIKTSNGTTYKVTPVLTQETI